MAHLANIIWCFQCTSINTYGDPGNAADASIDAGPSTPSEGFAVAITAAQAAAKAEFAVDGLSAAFPAASYPSTKSPTSYIECLDNQFADECLDPIQLQQQH